MISDFLTIFPVMGPRNTPHWQVGWDERRGIVRGGATFRKLWDIAFGTGTSCVIFVNKNNYLTVDAAVAYQSGDPPIDHMLDQIGGVSSVAFPTEDDAKKFADELEKLVMWKLLTREFNE